MDRLASAGGRGQDDGAATGDSTTSVSGASSGRAANRTDLTSSGTDGAGALGRGWRPDEAAPGVA